MEWPPISAAALQLRTTHLPPLPGSAPAACLQDPGSAGRAAKRVPVPGYPIAA
jgi:hypothetical protein